ncbi:MAG TPA: hypothetical protein P5534_09755 [Candidatus Paceibacterota bacterium]|nr:hypothetical protein [Candidatus Paceibacterota bacterium]HRZ58812.1 hypothetical protein [Candidatus Paceibacterota bacterium]
MKILHSHRSALGSALMIALVTGCSSEPDYRVIRTLDGLGPTSLTAGKDGNLYGTLEAGGGKGEGLVFKLKPDGTGFEVLHHFSGCLSGGADGSQPYGLIEGSDGTLYGTTRSGGVEGGVLAEHGLDAAGNGTVFKIGRDGTGYQVLHAFTGRDGDGFWPQAGLVEGRNGTLYGTTLEDSAEHGGVVGSGHGTVFTLNKDGSDYRVLYTFGTNATQGHQVWAKLILDSNGALYGTTDGGGQAQQGTVFRLNPGDGRYSVLHSFGSDRTDGRGPRSALVEGRDGLLYGTTPVGGNRDCGTVYKLAKDGSGYAVLHHFTHEGPDGQGPQGLVQGPDGVLYGTTHGRGAKGSGTLFSLRPDGSGFRVLHSFPSSPQDGGHPHGALVLTADSGLYGMTSTRENQSAAAVFRLSLPPPRSRSP